MLIIGGGKSGGRAKSKKFGDIPCFVEEISEESLKQRELMRKNDRNNLRQAAVAAAGVRKRQREEELTRKVIEYEEKMALRQRRAMERLAAQRDSRASEERQKLDKLGVHPERNTYVTGGALGSQTRSLAEISRASRPRVPRLQPKRGVRFRSAADEIEATEDSWEGDGDVDPLDEGDEELSRGNTGRNSTLSSGRARSYRSTPALSRRSTGRTTPRSREVSKTSAGAGGEGFTDLVSISHPLSPYQEYGDRQLGLIYHPPPAAFKDKDRSASTKSTPGRDRRPSIGVPRRETSASLPMPPPGVAHASRILASSAMSSPVSPGAAGSPVISGHGYVAFLTPEKSPARTLPRSRTVKPLFAYHYDLPAGSERVPPHSPLR